MSSIDELQEIISERLEFDDFVLATAQLLDKKDLEISRLESELKHINNMLVNMLTELKSAREALEKTRYYLEGLKEHEAGCNYDEHLLNEPERKGLDELIDWLSRHPEHSEEKKE